MLIVMNNDATAEQVDGVCATIKALGYTPRPMPGAQRTAVGVIGNDGIVPRESLAGLPGVRELIRVSKPYKLVSREFQSYDTAITVGSTTIGGGDLAMIAGPCSVEDRDTTLRIAERLAEIGVTLFRAGAFKPRTSPYSFQGRGQEGLDVLADIKTHTGMQVVTEVVDTESLPAVADVADILQVGARNMQHTSLLKRLGKIDKPVLLKRGIAATVDELLMAAEYIVSNGNQQVILCERGVRTFGTHARFMLDLAAVPVLKQLSHLPVIVDPSHAAGIVHLVEPLALAAAAVGCDGLIVEVHDEPTAAWCDGAQALLPEQLTTLHDKASAIRAVTMAPCVDRTA